ncbi:uncharacterized protein LOC109838801 [Asparagus officinalis]|uniref:uncharacterized protein LOC109838801 n=1 Tax=Asparagus officinalis TaxID=4686 RepID=UPI00098E275F|nr:uncharacterized protein LOC109838801 [Asparagus officinalis]
MVSYNLTMDLDESKVSRDPKDDLWAKQLEKQWESYFKVREPPTKDKLEAVKGQAIADFLTEHPILESSKLYEDIPDEVFESNAIPNHQIWQLYFKCASRHNHKGVIITAVGVVLIDPYGHVLTRAYSLTEPCSNNIAEYNALVIGLQLAQDMGVRYLEAHDDSKLIVNRIKGEYEVYHNDLIHYPERKQSSPSPSKASTLSM